ncbi:hypothetical protein [uncultured Nisaea sp.]|uniref:hypothetical protein n=1 Tax=uncultured Nisaea sp. TaxID=538215 RepID=UPI0030EC1FB2|tara:strand:- start:2997 stop:3878 length:882 start_codon:yes stop_codon:yes gene_type:complete
MQQYVILDEQAEREARVMHRYRVEVAAYWMKWHLCIALVSALGMIFLVGLVVALYNAAILGIGPTLNDWGDFSFLLHINIFNWRVDPDYYHRLVTYPMIPITLDHMPWAHLFGFITFGTCLITAMMSVLHFEPIISHDPNRYIRIEPVRLVPPIEVYFETDRGFDQKCVIDVIFTAPGPASAQVIREKSKAISLHCQTEIQRLVDSAVWQIRLPQLRRQLARIAVEYVPRDAIHDLKIRSIKMHPVVRPMPLTLPAGVTAAGATAMAQGIDAEASPDVPAAVEGIAPEPVPAE